MQSRLERRCIGLDVHRDFAQVAIWQGGVIRQAGRFATTPEGVRAFAQGSHRLRSRTCSTTAAVKSRNMKRRRLRR